MALTLLGSAAPSVAVLGKDVWGVFRVGAVSSGGHQEEEEGRCLMQPNVLNPCRGFWAHSGDSEHLSKARRQHFTCLYSKEKEPAAPINSPKLKYSCRAQCLRIKGEVLLLIAVVLSYPPASSCSRLHHLLGLISGYLN